MGLEYFDNGELNRSTEHIDRNTVDMESERPSFFELPKLDTFGYDWNEVSKWKSEDSERKIAELPQLRELVSMQEIKLYSTYEERIRQTPRENSDRGEWSGDRGESDFTPNDKEIQDILGKYDKERIKYENGMPDFSEVAESTVKIDNMTENRADNFRQCDEKCAEQWNKEGRDGRTDWSARDVKEWRQENGYSWHERNDMKTCDLVPTKVNDYFGHLGGVSECKKCDSEIGGSDFDE